MRHKYFISEDSSPCNLNLVTKTVVSMPLHLKLYLSHVNVNSGIYTCLHTKIHTTNFFFRMVCSLNVILVNLFLLYIRKLFKTGKVAANKYWHYYQSHEVYFCSYYSCKNRLWAKQTSLDIWTFSTSIKCKWEIWIWGKRVDAEIEVKWREEHVGETEERCKAVVRYDRKKEGKVRRLESACFKE